MGEEVWEHRGITISFPFKPYDSQREYTEKVLDCLIDAHNGLLESPTGTGKTLALLCASVAWQRHIRAKTALGGDPGPGPSGHGGVNQDNRPRVFYSSRTHSQLAQVMAQVKRLDLESSAIVLGSRDQLCVHPKVKEKPTVSEKNKLCNFLVKAKQCEFYNNFNRSDDPTNKMEVQGVQDIEDLVKASTKRRVCPYYRSRELSANAEFVFLPYNYLIDRTIRKSLPVGLGNSLVIMDEAHNVAKVCEESASLSFETQDIALALTEIESVIKLMEDKESSDLDLSQLSQGGTGEELAVEDAYLVKEALLNLEDTISKMLREKELSIDQSYPGNHLTTILERSSIDASRSMWLLHTIQQVMDILSSLASIGSRYSGRGLETIVEVMKTAFMGGSSSSEMKDESLKRYFNLHVTRSPKKETNTVFNFWCFHPGLAMRSITECGTRSLILTSGTLKPIPVTAQELDIPFMVNFAGPHVIDPKQVLVRTINKGVDNVDLISTFQNRSNPSFLKSLGKSIREIMRLVPNGMLVFFPSYSLMDSCLSAWKDFGVYDAMAQEKLVVVEPRDKSSFDQAITEFRRKAEDPNGSGACLMAVCRGKIAEGIDFSDSMARAVVITGIPFPNAFDARIKLKKTYVDTRKKEASQFMTGNDWYKLEAFRAVNQAIGRVIRHKNDFGAIFFLDKRFSDNSVKMSLSDWASKSAESASLPEALRAAGTFFRTFKAESKGCQSSSTSFMTTKASNTSSNVKRKVHESAPTYQSPPIAGPASKHRKIVLKGNTSANVLKYKATNVVLKMKEKLSKEDMKRFKTELANYKQAQNLVPLLQILKKFMEYDSLVLDEILSLREFILDKDVAEFEAFFQ